MLKWFKQLDEILRGDATLMSSLRNGQIDIPVGGLAVVTVLMGVIYGACMGSFGVTHPEGSGYMQIIASAVKLPLLFALTLVVTFPSLYVFNALVGSRLSMSSVLRLVAAMTGVMLAVLASLGPIVVFFSLSTSSYPFMKLLNVAMCTVAGVLGLAYLLRTLHRLVLVQDQLDELKSQPQNIQPEVTSTIDEQTPPSSEAGVESPAQVKTDPSTQGVEALSRGALELVGGRTNQRARQVFQIWVIVFALVGAQMSWVLRPFIGSPYEPFAWFRAREGNFFETVVTAFFHLFK